MKCFFNFFFSIGKCSYDSYHRNEMCLVIEQTELLKVSVFHLQHIENSSVKSTAKLISFHVTSCILLCHPFIGKGVTLVALKFVYVIKPLPGYASVKRFAFNSSPLSN